jgi:hypothetical protein
MTDSKKTSDPFGFVVDYKPLGTIPILELAHAVFEDMHALSDIYSVRFVKAPRLRFVPTDERGAEVRVIHPAGGTVKFLSTHHFRPACKDYEL